MGEGGGDKLDEGVTFTQGGVIFVTWLANVGGGVTSRGVRVPKVSSSLKHGLLQNVNKN